MINIDNFLSRYEWFPKFLFPKNASVLLKNLVDVFEEPYLK